MMRITVFLLLGVEGLFYGCVRDTSRVARLEYKGVLDTLEMHYRDSGDGFYPVDLCAVFNKPDWDSIVIVPPYTPLDYLRKADFCDVSYVLGPLEDVLYVDGYTSVLFIKQRCVVGYSVVWARSGLMYVTGFSDREIMPVLARSDCKVRLRRHSGEYGVSYYFYPWKTSVADSVLEREMKEKFEVRDSVSLDSLIGK